MLRKSLDGISDKSKNYLDRISASSARMINLVREVLNFSQLSKQGHPFEQVDLNVVLNQVKDDFELLIMEKEAAITSEALPAIEGISLQINQLFSNLISNSLKFVAVGKKPVMSIKAAPLAKAALAKYPFLLPELSYCSIEFKDNGIGFEQEYGEQIFALFQRLHGKHEYSGSGIGLALCKKIVGNHHGHIYASSVPGEGAIFGVILPLRQPEKEVE
jgi:signal transduction histidine kinase